MTSIPSIGTGVRSPGLTALSRRWLARGGATVLLLFPSRLKAIDRAWDGGDALNVLWSDPTNWNPNSAPAAGDRLIFPSGVADVTTNNDFAAGTLFLGLEFTGDNYAVNGSGFRLGASGILMNVAGTGDAAINVLVMLADAQVWSMAASDTLTVGGAVSAMQGARLSKTGSGILRLTGTNTLPVLRIEAGTVVVTGDSSAMECELDGASAVLNGSGETGAITSLAAGGLLAPGFSGAAILRSGDVALNAASTFQVELQSNTAPGTTYDQLAVAGTVSPGGASLVVSLSAGFSAVPGDEFTIVRNDDADLITGTFAGLSEGTFFTAGGEDFHITYTGGDGNDVVLTKVVPPTGNTKRWSGLSAANDNWTTGANWVGGIAPSPGDRLIFPAGAGRMSNNNDFAAGTAFHAITVQASGYNLSGNQVVLNAGLSATHVTAGASTISLPLRPALDQTISSNGGLTFGGAIDLDGKVVVFSKTTTVGNMIVHGVISGAGTLRKQGDGSLFLNAANTYSATTFIEAGLIDIQTATSLGTALTSVEEGGTLVVSSNVSINGPANTLALAGTLISTGASHGWLGTVTLVGSPVINVNTALNLSGGILGSGGVTKTGTAALRLSGGLANSFTGGLTVSQGVVELAKTPGVTALPGPVTVGDGAGTDTLRLLSFDQIADTATVHLNGGILDLSNQTETIATLNATGGTVQGNGPSARLDLEAALATLASAVPTTLTGWVRCGNDMTWTIADGAAEDDLVVNGPLNAFDFGVVLRKEGPGRVAFAGGAVVPVIVAAAGTARFTGSSSSQVRLDGGTLDGTGTVGHIASTGGGTVAPGLSPGRLTCTGTGWNAQTTFEAELLSSATPGTTYDQLVVNGPVNLGGASLHVTTLAGFSGSIGDTFIIIDNDEDDAVTGAFAGLPAGSVVIAGAGAFSISYTGGTGNDVVLTRVEPPVIPNLTSMTITPGGGPGGEDVVAIGGTAEQGTMHTLEASTNLTSWTDVQTITADSGGVLSFTVIQTPGLPRRFFRIEP